MQAPLGISRYKRKFNIKFNATTYNGLRIFPDLLKRVVKVLVSQNSVPNSAL